MNRSRSRLFLFTLLTILVCSHPISVSAKPGLDAIRLPAGFKISVFAEVPRARSMAVARKLNTVFVGTRGNNVYAAIDSDGDGRAETVERVLGGLTVPNGIVWKDDVLYVAEQHRIVQYAAPDLTTLKKAPAEVLFDGLPDDRWHGWRYAAMGPDGYLYVSVGAPCNICKVSGMEGTIIRLDPQRTNPPQIFATGVRNSVGMAFHPQTGDLHFTDNGADNMGDDSPPDELNHAPRPGLFFGYPYFGGGDHRSPDFRNMSVPRTATFPVVAFGAHVASLGIHFYQGSMFPPEYSNSAFVAQHGSWNRSVPDGYRLVRVTFGADGIATGYTKFAEGWLDAGGDVFGRPVDIKELADGSLLVSDDRAGVIYRITYSER